LEQESISPKGQGGIAGRRCFFPKRVEYYREADAPGSRWPLPKRIASSKLNTFHWQAEYRLMFSTTGALEFESVDLQLNQGERVAPPSRTGPTNQTISVGCLRDTCRMHKINE